jgi:hypothetical protein
MFRKALPFMLAITAAMPASAGEWSGRVAGEWLYFWNDPLDPDQHNGYLSGLVEPEYTHEWAEGKRQFNFALFGQVDQYDDERTHADLRELEYLHIAEKYEWRIGVRRVFWGVTESQHLVDIINQTDLVVNPDGEDKLGQPMVNLALIGDYGTVDLFVLTGFRERTVPGEEGRPRFGAVVDNDLAVYESGKEQGRVDLAARWSKSVSGADIGLSYFYGTGRAPRLTAVKLNAALPPSATNLVLAPSYDIIEQAGLDAQLASGSTLWKAELISRREQDERVFLSTIGFEYTFTGVLKSPADIGVLSEYLYDSRGEEASTLPAFGKSATQPPTPFQNDLFVGGRFTFNDVQNSQILAGMIFDLEGRGRTYNLEAERRLGESWKISLEWRGYAEIPPVDVLYTLRDDDSIRTELAWYF